MKTVLSAILAGALASGAASLVPAPLVAQPSASQMAGTWSTQGARGWGARYAPDVRLWLENDREVFQSGERMMLRFRTSEDAYVAVLHVDTDGEVSLVFPESEWDDAYVRGGRTYALPRGRADGYWTVRSRSGIGYFHIVASAEPLNLREFSRFGSVRGGPFNGRTVRGDPFYALETLTRRLVGSPFAPYSVDTYSYSVGGRYRYPSYACSDAYASSMWDWGSYYGSCDRVLGLLRSEPYYYDTRRYRRDRDRYFREWAEQPRHEYKAPAAAQRGNEPARAVLPPSYGAPSTAPARVPRESEAQQPRVTRPEPQSQAAPSARPESQRPRLERRPEESRPEPRAEPRPQPRSEPRAEPRAESRPQPRAEPPKESSSAPSGNNAPRVGRPDPEG
jgi:hypothetical protein